MRRRGIGSRSMGVVVVGTSLLVALGACGYKPLDGRGVFGPDVKTIELESFENESREPGLEQHITDAMAEEFARRAWLEPVMDGQVASPDLVMTGLVRTATVRADTYSSGGLALEERIDVRLDIAVRRRESGELVYQHPDFRAREVFLSSADPMVYASNKEQAMRRVASAIAEQVHDELFQRF